MLTSRFHLKHTIWMQTFAFFDFIRRLWLCQLQISASVSSLSLSESVMSSVAKGSFGAMVMLLPCDLEVTGLNFENSLLQYRAARFRQFWDAAAKNRRVGLSNPSKQVNRANQAE